MQFVFRVCVSTHSLMSCLYKKSAPCWVNASSITTGFCVLLFSATNFEILKFRNPISYSLISLASTLGISSPKNVRCSVSDGLEWQKIWIPISATKARVRTALGQILPYVPDMMGLRTEPASSRREPWKWHKIESFNTRQSPTRASQWDQTAVLSG